MCINETADSNNTCPMKIYSFLINRLFSLYAGVSVDGNREGVSGQGWAKTNHTTRFDQAIIASLN